MCSPANSGGGYLQLKGESNWEENESSILASHGLGVLHIADLVSAINTLPLYTQLNMPEESFPVSSSILIFLSSESSRILPNFSLGKVLSHFSLAKYFSHTWCYFTHMKGVG